jgi:hypothetical protein
MLLVSESVFLKDTDLGDMLSPGEEDDFDYTESFPSHEGKNRPDWTCMIMEVSEDTPKPETESKDKEQ